MRGEIHLFIIWHKARYMETELLEDISGRFTILEKIELIWEANSLADNLVKFYGMKLPSLSDKLEAVGEGPSLLVIVEDTSPQYVIRRTNSGTTIVNINMYDSKEMYRTWLTGTSVHGTNDETETEHDLLLLTGVELTEAKKIYSLGGCIDKYKKEL